MAAFMVEPSSGLPGRAHGGPDLLRGEGQIHVGDAQGGQRVHHRIGDGRRGADGRGLADALDAEGSPRRMCARVVIVEGDQVVALGQRIVHEARGEELAALVESRLLPERLADALGEAAVDLALDEQRIDEEARIVYRHVAEKARLARVPVDLDHGHVSAEGEEHAAAGLDVLLRMQAALGGCRDLLPGDRTVGHAPHGESAVGRPDVGGRRLEAICCAFSRTLVALPRACMPPRAADRLPKVPTPLRTRAVSPWTTLTMSMGICSSSATSCAKAVSCPWPCEAEPVSTVTRPSSATTTSETSSSSKPQIST